MKLFNFKKDIIVTHNGKFHADDAFAVATILLFTNRRSKIIRTRDEKEFSKADYVVDVGGKYEPSLKMFDHHQLNFSEAHPDRTLRAGFGLVWKEYGEKICGNKEVAEMIDEELVKYVDGMDNGTSFFDIPNNITICDVSRIIESLSPTWLERENNELNIDKAFLEAVNLAQKIINRCIKKNKDFLLGKDKVIEVYNKTLDKRILLLEHEYPFSSIVIKYPEPLFVVSPNSSNGTWSVNTVKKDKNSFVNRLDLPVAWAGKTGEELAKITGIADAVFCHRAKFLAVAKSKEGAIKLAEKALLK